MGYFIPTHRKAWAAKRINIHHDEKRLKKIPNS
jgi:hypothetical protein